MSGAPVRKGNGLQGGGAVAEQEPNHYAFTGRGPLYDTGSTSFSFLIPRTTLQNGQPVHIRTAGITALHRLTVDTPAHGQLDTYQLHRLTGTASFVEL